MAVCQRCGKKGLLLKVNADGICPDCEKAKLQSEIAHLETRLCPEEQEILRLKKEIQDLSKTRDIMQSSIAHLKDEKSDYETEISLLKAEIREKKQQIIQFDDAILVQDFGLYEPRYDFCNAERYKEEIIKIRSEQKEMIKTDWAVTGANNWTLNGNATAGKRMIKDMKKLLLRAFNGECDEIIAKVKYNNFEPSLKRITASRDAVSKLGQTMGIAIAPYYYELKIQELRLALEYQMMKQKEKEEQRMLREQQREEAKLQKEIEEARKKATKEQNHYLNALEKIKNQLAKEWDETKKYELAEKQREIEFQLEEIEKALQDIDYRQANQRAGYVYVISNIGSFGENIYKIGMTRRLDPTERVDELGDASVPFKFDIHAMIFSDDAPALENALHKAFDNRKLNMVNQRREFFRVTLDEIKAVVKANYDKTAEFIDVADAEQYRLSEKMRQNLTQ